MTHRPYLERAAHVLAAISLAFGILATAPIAEAFRSTPAPFRAEPARAPLGMFSPGDLVARVALERLKIDAPVYEGVGSESLSRGAGHLPGTALPGEDAATLRDTLLAVPRDNPASGLVHARVGDTVTMRTPFGVRRYRVAERRVIAPDAIRPTASQGRTITIVTPYPADAIGPAPLRLALVLRARGAAVPLFP
jgi:sortase A